MRRVLVTGGAGFLGSHLCERLIARGDEVLCVDNVFTGWRPATPLSEGLSRTIDFFRGSL